MGVAIEAELPRIALCKKIRRTKRHVAYKQHRNDSRLFSQRLQEPATLGLAGDGTVDAELAPESVGGASRHCSARRSNLPRVSLLRGVPAMVFVSILNDASICEYSTTTERIFGIFLGVAGS